MNHMLSAVSSVYHRKPSISDIFNIPNKECRKYKYNLSKINNSIFAGKFLPHPLISMLKDS